MFDFDSSVQHYSQVCICKKVSENWKTPIVLLDYLDTYIVAQVTPIRHYILKIAFRTFKVVSWMSVYTVFFRHYYRMHYVYNGCACPTEESYGRSNQKEDNSTGMSSSKLMLLQITNCDHMHRHKYHHIVSVCSRMLLLLAVWCWSCPTLIKRWLLRHWTLFSCWPCL